MDMKDCSQSSPGQMREDFLQNPMAMIHDIDRLTHERVKASAPPMQRSHRMILMHLARRDNVTQLDLVHATHLKAPTVSVCLQKMERDGLVERKADEKDLRATRVFLTAKGLEIDRQVVSKIREQEQRVSDCLTTEEKEILVSLLAKIRTNLLEENEESEN